VTGSRNLIYQLTKTPHFIGLQWSSWGFSLEFNFLVFSEIVLICLIDLELEIRTFASIGKGNTSFQPVLSLSLSLIHVCLLSNLPIIIQMFAVFNSICALHPRPFLTIKRVKPNFLRWNVAQRLNWILFLQSINKLNLHLSRLNLDSTSTSKANKSRPSLDTHPRLSKR
jgi:hypothetical protein